MVHLLVLWPASIAVEALEVSEGIRELAVDSCAMQIATFQRLDPDAPMELMTKLDKDHGSKRSKQVSPFLPESEAVFEAEFHDFQPASWVASHWSRCNGGCSPPVKYRSVVCKSYISGDTLDDSECAARQKPISYKSCGCDLEICAQAGECSAPEDPVTIPLPSYAEVGCFKLPAGDPGVTCPADVDDEYCINWNSTTETGLCKSGFPFFSFCGNMTALTCFQHCITKGLDMFAMVDSHECRCGASVLNTDLWSTGHGNAVPPPPGKSFDAIVVTELEKGTAGECPLHVYRYTGSYHSGFIPWNYASGLTQETTLYVASVVEGKLIEPNEAEANQTSVVLPPPPFTLNVTRKSLLELGQDSAGSNLKAHSNSNLTLNCDMQIGHLVANSFVDCDDGWWKLGDPYTCANLETITGLSCAGCACPGDLDASLQPPLYRRNCYPATCTASVGPWMGRQSTAPAGVAAVWDEYVTIPYAFHTSVDNSEQAVLREAADAWSDVTCISFEETSDTSQTHFTVTTQDSNSCEVNILGQANSILQMGRCNSASDLGTIIHELGHIIGMKHEMKRPDAHENYHGHGPYLTFRWGNIGSNSAQYEMDAKTYTGSTHDGDGDPWGYGYSPYDYYSIMHYSATNKFTFTETIANQGQVGQRTRLSDMDVMSALDIYQCHANDASRLAKGLMVAGPFCSTRSSLATVYVLGGQTADGKPWYASADGSIYLYYDAQCDGVLLTSARWIFDSTAPSTTATSDLDADSACDYYAHSVTVPTIAVWRGVPLGKHMFRLECGSGVVDWQEEEATFTGIVPLSITGHCITGVDGYYAQMGWTRTNRPYYGNGVGYYLYYDPDCSGSGTAEGRWILGDSAPDNNLYSSLGGGCPEVGYNISEATEVPRGSSEWMAYCGRRRTDESLNTSGSWTPTTLTIEDAVLPPTPPPTRHPDCNDTDAGAQDSQGNTCLVGYAHHYPEWCGQYDDADFTSEDLCCVCGGGIWPTDAPTSPPTFYPTPVPTVGVVPTPAPPPPPTPPPPPPSTAVGDPHITNLVNVSFDVNKPGEHVLLRVPFDNDLPAQLSVRAKMYPTPISPCGLWITEVLLSGEMVGDDIRVHRQLKDMKKNETVDHFALYVGSSSARAKAKDRWKPWGKFTKDAEVNLTGQVSLRPTFGNFQGAGAIKGRRAFEFLIGAPGASGERVSIAITQASNPALDVHAHRLGNLGATRVGGIMGTEDHDPLIEEPSAKCASHLRSTGAMKQHDWQRIIAHINSKNSAAASFASTRAEYEQAADMSASW